MKPIKCLIVEDEPLAAKVLEKYIARLDHLQLVGKAENAVEAFNILNSKAVDLLFLDIKMPQITGTDFLRSLRNPPAVVFTTAYRDFALEGFELAAIDYLLKPISFERFMTAVSRFQYPTSESNVAIGNKTEDRVTGQEFIFVREDKRMKKVMLSDILFVESIKDYVKIITPNSGILTYLKMGYLEENLPNDRFIRVHKSYIANINAIQAFSATEIEIADTMIPIGRYYKQTVLQKLEHLML